MANDNQVAEVTASKCKQVRGLGRLQLLELAKPELWLTAGKTKRAMSWTGLQDNKKAGDVSHLCFASGWKPEL